MLSVEKAHKMQAYMDPHEQWEEEVANHTEFLRRLDSEAEDISQEMVKNWGRWAPKKKIEMFKRLCSTINDAKAVSEELALLKSTEPPEEVGEDELWEGQCAIDALLARRYEWPAE